MHSLISLAVFLPYFTVLSQTPGPWPDILSSIGLEERPAALATIFVARPGTPASPEWPARVENGAFLILEGESSLAEMFGFRRAEDNVTVNSVQDAHRPKLSIVWQKPLELPRFDIPPHARVFAKERWNGAPLVAGARRGKGAVLWISAPPGEHGYERFPYLLQALGDLGLEPPFRSNRLWAFFDYSYRSRVDLDYFARRWRRSGIAALHVAAWHFYDADPERDEYLKRLIAACHQNGILVYAWLELPHVSEQFWKTHPEWREKTALLQDAHLDWRKLMNLINRECFTTVSKGIRELINRFDWDGINLAELYFESLEGAGNASRFTPMNDDVRQMFKAAHGFDPIEIFTTRKDAASLRLFLDFRAELARRMQEEWLAQLEQIRQVRPQLDLVLTHVDDRFDTGMKDAIGADAARVLPLLEKYPFTFLIEDPATVWHLGPQRYSEIARRYHTLTPRRERLAIDINIVERYQNVYPTKQQTGIELFQLVHLASRSFSRVALYFENSILAADSLLLAAAASTVGKTERVGKGLAIESPFGVGLRWSGPATVDGKPWPVASDDYVWLPAGSHIVEPATSANNPARVVDFNGDLLSARYVQSGGIQLAYRSDSRVIAILSRRVLGVEIDEVRTQPELLGNTVVVLPRGQHLVTIQTE